MERLIESPDQAYDEGKVIAVSERVDGLLVTMQEPMAEFELGFTVNFADMSLDYEDPQVGDSIEIRGHGSPFGINYLSVNGFVHFDRTVQQQQIIHEIRKREAEIQKLWEAFVATEPEQDVR